MTLETSSDQTILAVRCWRQGHHTLCKTTDLNLRNVRVVKIIQTSFMKASFEGEKKGQRNDVQNFLAKEYIEGVVKEHNKKEWHLVKSEVKPVKKVSEEL